MRAKTVYRSAAELIDSKREVYSCNAISRVRQRISQREIMSDSLRRNYRNVMGPEGYPYPVDFEAPDYFLKEVNATEDPRGLRVMLLLMMAAACGDFRLDTEPERG